MLPRTNLNVVFLVITSCLLYTGHAEVSIQRVSNKIYKDLQNNATCFRRMNATHQIGCTSHRNGNVGIVHILQTETDLDWLIESGSNPPYIVVFTEPSLFTIQNMIRLKKSDKANGVIVAISRNHTTDYPEGFSSEKSCPNENFGLYTSSKNSKYANCKQGDWIDKSSAGLNMLYEDWGFPMSLIYKEDDLNALKQCYEKFNKPKTGNIDNWAMCAAELKTRMSAAKDTPTCMRRSTLMTNINPSVICDSLGDKNLYTYLHEHTDLDDRSIIVVTARFDSSSVFYGLTPGADSSVSGTVALLAVSRALTKVKDEFMKLTNNKTNVMFVLFNGESFDYIGSSRMVYDMLKGKLPMKLSQISHIIELNQVASAQSSFWVHTDPITLANTSTSVNQLFSMLEKEGSSAGISIKRSDESRALPPASLQSFLTEDGSISAVLIGNFNEDFSNKYYGGIYDDATNINYDPNNMQLPESIAKLATTVARTIFQIATNETTTVQVEKKLVNEMLYCYLKSASCNLYKQALPTSLVDKLADIPYSLYVGVSSVTNEVTIATSYLMHYLTGKAISSSEEKCNSDESTTYRYAWIVGPNVNKSGVCYQSLMKNHSAVSPAFDIDDWTSSKYSTWTESRWDSFTVRIFLRPSFYNEVITLVLGIAIFAVSLVLVYFTNKRAYILFEPIASDLYGHGVPC